MPAKPTRLNKQEILDRWSQLSPDTPIRVTPISYRHKGSTFDQDSIRITGSQEFIDSILARLSDLLKHDSNGNRLHVMYVQTVDRTTQELTGTWGCYVQVHERGQGRFGGGRPPRRQRAVTKPVEATQSPVEGPDSPVENSEPEETDGPPVEPEQPVAASLAAPVRSRKPKAGDIRYALAYTYDDGEYEWAEPNGGPGGCDTYDDEQEARDSFRAFERTPGVVMHGLSVVKVRKNAKGKMELAK